MKLKLSVLTLLFAGLTFTACQKEELEKAPNPSNTIEVQDAPIEQEGRRFTPLAVLDATACGYGFNCDIQWHTGGQAVGSWNYEIWQNGSVVDSGSISDGDQTNWVLAPCTTSIIKFYGSWANSMIPSQILVLTTDGCGNNFVC